MKIKKLSFLMAVFASVALLGCEKGDNELDRDTMKSHYYVQTYLDADDFELKEIEGNGIYTVGIFFSGERISILPPADKVGFEKLAKAFNDVTYTWTLILDANKALTAPLTSISIVCDKEYDTEHGSGSNLDDIVLFCATSPYEFIQGGYKDVVKSDEYPAYWKNMVTNQGIGYKAVEMLVSAVNKENSCMLYPICHLYFKKRPIKDGEYLFTVTVRTGETEMAKKIAHRF